MFEWTKPTHSSIKTVTVGVAVGFMVDSGWLSALVVVIIGSALQVCVEHYMTQRFKNDISK